MSLLPDPRQIRVNFIMSPSDQIMMPASILLHPAVAGSKVFHTQVKHGNTDRCLTDHGEQLLLAKIKGFLRHFFLSHITVVDHNGFHAGVIQEVCANTFDSAPCSVGWYDTKCSMII